MAKLFWRLVVFLGLAGSYLFLAGSIDGVELTAMLVCAGAGATLAAALEIVAKRNYVVWASPRAILRPFLALLPETLVVGQTLIAAAAGSRAHGRLVDQPFEPGDDDPRSATRRALTVIGVSLAPRTFVVRGERTDTLLLHGLPAKAPSSDHAWPT